MSDIPVHLQTLFRRLVDLPLASPPAPWGQSKIHAIGGLTDVAFAHSSDLLLVISSAGRGLFDCLSGERIARDPSEDFEYDTFNLLAPGIGPLADQHLRTAGLHGGGLALSTSDGWSLARLALSWPNDSIFLTPPGHWIYGPAFDHPGEATKIATESEIRAFGFSPTGRSFILATSSDLTVFIRNA